MRPRFPEAVRRLRSIALVASAVRLVWAPSTQARATRIIIDATTSVAGHPWYEQLTGRAFGELDELQRRIEREPAACWRIAPAILKANITA